MFSPTLNGTRTHLASETLATARFWIGPASPESAVPREERRVNPDILRVDAPIRLRVSMVCNVCTAPPPPAATIFYDPNEGRSTAAHFPFTPRANFGTDLRRHSDVVFMVSAEGTRYDRVVVPVLVDPEPDAPDVSAPHRSRSHTGTPTPPDVLIRIGASNGAFLRLEISPLNSRLRAQISNVVG
ncbi:MAG: hypothetical protein Q8N52_00285, partial [Acidobacteriota bacterium]|nr:hypothetical protein [Acidobacteriota bacterium]